MKRGRVTLIAFLVPFLLVLALLLYRGATTPSTPTLIFVRYAQLENDHSWYAELHLTNNTQNTIEYYTDAMTPASNAPPIFLNRVRLPTGTNVVFTEVGLKQKSRYTPSGGYAQFAYGSTSSLKPGEFVVLDVTIVPGALPKEVGMSYHRAFVPGNNLVGYIWFTFHKLKRSLRMRDHLPSYEVWCPEMLSAPAHP